MYYEGQIDIKIDDKDKDHHDGSVFVINLLEQMTNFCVEMYLDEHCSDLVTRDNKRCTISNHKTLTCTLTHQGAREVVV